MTKPAPDETYVTADEGLREIVEPTLNLRIKRFWGQKVLQQQFHVTVVCGRTPVSGCFEWRNVPVVSMDESDE